MAKLGFVVLAGLLVSSPAIAQQQANKSCRDYFMGCERYCNGHQQRCYGVCETKYNTCKQTGTYETGDGQQHQVTSRE